MRAIAAMEKADSSLSYWPRNAMQSTLANRTPRVLVLIIFKYSRAVLC